MSKPALCRILLILSAALLPGPARTAVIEGVVRAADGGIVAGALVTLTSEDRLFAETVYSDSGGAFRLETSQAGFLTLRVRKPYFADESRNLDITAGGTIELVIFGGVVPGILGGLVYLGVRRWVAGFGPFRGLAFGLFLLAALGWAVIQGDNPDFPRLGSPLLNIGMFALIYVLFGLLVAPLHDWMERALPRPSRSMRGLGSLGIQAFGLLLALEVVVGAVGNGFGESENIRPYVMLVSAYLLVAVPVAGAFLARGAGRFQRLSDLRGQRGWLMAAMVVVALPVGLGAVLDMQAVSDIFQASR